MLDEHWSREDRERMIDGLFVDRLEPLTIMAAASPLTWETLHEAFEKLQADPALGFMAEYVVPPTNPYSVESLADRLGAGLPLVQSKYVPDGFVYMVGNTMVMRLEDVVAIVDDSWQARLRRWYWRVVRDLKSIARQFADLFRAIPGLLEARLAEASKALDEFASRHGS